MLICQMIYILLCHAVLGPAAVAGQAEKSGESLQLVQGKWEISGAVAKRLDTPLGTLYQFTPGKRFSLQTQADDRDPHPVRCRCSECLTRFSMSALLCEVPSAAGKSRFVALDFQLRQFPAFHGGNHRQTHFVIMQSDQKSPGNDYDKFWGQLHNLESYESTTQEPIDPSSPRRTPLALLMTGRLYQAQYQPQAIRIIFDTQPDGLIYCVINGHRRLIPKYDDPRLKRRRPAIRNLGFAVQEAPDQALHLELSAPVIRWFSREEDLMKLLTGQPERYPYERFSDSSGSKIRTGKNPDFLYHQALEKLYNTRSPAQFSPESGVELLKRAERDDHVFALYELGICHFRGLGVAADTAKALKYFTRAALAGDEKARAMKTMLEIRREVAQTIPSPAFLEQLQQQREKDIPLLLQEALGENAKASDYSAYLDLIQDLHGINPSEFSYRQLLRGAFEADLEAFHPSSADNQSKRDKYQRRSSLFGKSQIPLWAIRLEWQETEKYWSGFDPAEARRAIAAGYIPAAYALAVHLNHQSRRNKTAGQPEIEAEIDALLQQSAQGGMHLAVLLQLERALQNGTPTPTLSPQLKFDLADEPWLAFLEYAQDHPAHPVVQTFLRAGHAAARRQLAGTAATRESNYLRGLLTLMHWTGPIRTVNQKLHSHDAVYRLETLALFQNAAEHGQPQAQYFYGKLLLENPPGLTPDGSNPNTTLARGLDYLRRAAAQGHFKAAFLCAQHEKKPAPAQKYLDLVCEAKIHQGWLLRAHLHRHHDFQASKLALETAAQLGSAQAYSQLALQSTNPIEKKRLWTSFLLLDQRLRTLDILDCYSPKTDFKTQWLNSNLVP